MFWARGSRWRRDGGFRSGWKEEHEETGVSRKCSKKKGWMCLHFCLNQHFLVHLTCYVNNTLFDRIIQISVHEEFEGLFQAWFSIFFILYLNGPYEERCEWNLMYLWHLVRVVFFLVLDDTFFVFFHNYVLTDLTIMDGRWHVARHYDIAAEVLLNQVRVERVRCMRSLVSRTYSRIKYIWIWIIWE